MTIEEAIAQAREKADKNSGCWKHCASIKDCDECEQEHKQLAEWLEKLQYVENIILKWNADWYNDEDNGIPDNEILEAIFNACTGNGFDIPIDEDFRKGYNKAIDDFAEKALCNIQEFDEPLSIIDIKCIAEQLKTGGENEI